MLRSLKVVLFGSPFNTLNRVWHIVICGNSIPLS